MRTDLKKGTILVTGACGFIGSAVVWRLNDLGYEDIFVSDRLRQDERWKNLVPLKFRDIIHADDLQDSSALDECMTVFHLGAVSATTEPDADYLLRNNYEYTKKLAENALRRGARFVYASSAATYGEGESGMDDDMEDLSRLKPLNMYGYSKHLFDLWAMRKGVSKDLVGLKYYNVYGPNEWHKGDMRSVVHKAFEQVRDHGSISLFRSHRSEYADGDQMRDFVYVKDAVDATIHLAAESGAGGLYNVGRGKAQTWNDLASAVFQALDKDPVIEYIEMPESLKGKYQYFTEAKLDRLRASGFTREMKTIFEGVNDYVRNYLVPGKLLGE